MVDTFKTRDQFIQEALLTLSIIEPGEAAAAEDYDTVYGKVDTLLAQLATDNICYIQNPEQIDLDLFEPLVRLLANVCGPRFGSPVNMEAKKDDENTLRRLTSRPPSYEVMRGNYF